MLLNSDAIDLDILRGDDVAQQGAILALVIFAVLSAILLLAAWILYERATEPREPLLLLIVPGTAAGFTALVILFIAVIIPGATGMKPCEEQCRAEVEQAQTVIEDSLNETYDITGFTPLRTAGPEYSVDAVSEEGIWGRDWILDALTSAPRDAPVADVQLPDGTLTVWAVTVDPVTGKAQFFSSYDGPAPGSVVREPGDRPAR